MAWLGNWGNRKKITISNANVDAVLSGFPFRSKISSSSGTGSTDLTDIFDELAQDANRKKIAVTISDGITQCYVEIELWDDANEKAELWIKAPSVASGSVTVLYIYYDSSQPDNTTYVGDTGDTPAQSVWDANFKVVYHMAQDPNGDPANAIKDSTSNANHGTPGGGMTSADLVDGKIGKAIDFDGGNDFIKKDSVSFSTRDVFTLESTAKMTLTGAIQRLVVLEDYADEGPQFFIRFTAANYAQVFGRGSGTDTAAIITDSVDLDDSSFHSIAGIIDGNIGKAELFRDGLSKGSIIESQFTFDTMVSIYLSVYGASTGNAQHLGGISDEVRISNIARSAAWIKATYYSNWDELVEYGPSESLGFQGIQNALSSIGELIKILSVINSLGEQSQDGIINSFGDQSQNGIFNPIGEQSQDGIINSFGDQSQDGIINSFGEQSQDAVSAALGLELNQPIRLDLSPGIQQIQELLQRLCEGDPFTSLQSLENKLVDDKRRIQGLLNIISGSIEGAQAAIQSISSGDVASLQKLLLEITEKDSVTGRQKLLQSLQDMAVTFPAVDYDIFLDGISIKSKITEAVVSYGEDSVHNSVNIQSMQSDLFWDCDPAELEGISRIEVRAGTRQMYFLLEKRTGDEQSFSLWGRSLSAREDSPYAVDLDYSLDEPKSAKSVIEEILAVSSLNWQCDDWMLPASFEFEGPPIEGISQIAAAIGAVVRCEDDGTICVRQRFPIRPVDMNGAGVAVNYDRTKLTRLDYDNVKGSHYNAVEVVGCTDDVYLPDIYIEESSPIVGTDVHIRVYWAGEKPSRGIGTYVTDGRIISLGEKTREEEESETITFEDGVASVSKPITSIVSVKWIGDYGGNVSYKRYSRDLEIANKVYRIAKIIYKTTYSRYRISDHDVEILLALLTFGGESDVSVKVKMGDGDKLAPVLNRPLLTTQSIAVVAGTAYLDANKYDQKKVVLETPYNDAAVDGILAYINDAEIDCVGNFHIENCDIIISGPRIINQLGVVQCQV